MAFIEPRVYLLTHSDSVGCPRPPRVPCALQDTAQSLVCIEDVVDGL